MECTEKQKRRKKNEKKPHEMVICEENREKESARHMLHRSGKAYGRPQACQEERRNAHKHPSERAGIHEAGFLWVSLCSIDTARDSRPRGWTVTQQAQDQGREEIPLLFIIK